MLNKANKETSTDRHVDSMSLHAKTESTSTAAADHPQIDLLSNAFATAIHSPPMKRFQKKLLWPTVLTSWYLS